MQAARQAGQQLEALLRPAARACAAAVQLPQPVNQRRARCPLVWPPRQALNDWRHKQRCLVRLYVAHSGLATEQQESASACIGVTQLSDTGGRLSKHSLSSCIAAQVRTQNV